MVVKKIRELIPVGECAPFSEEKGVHEAFIPGLKDGDVFWTVNIGDGALVDVLRQEDALMLSSLVRIERLLRQKGVG